MSGNCGLKILAPPHVSSTAMSRSFQPDWLNGSVELFLAEAATVVDLEIAFIGLVHGRIASKDGTLASKEICRTPRQLAHKKKLEGGLHPFKFSLSVWPNLPASVAVRADSHFRGFAVEYSIIATATIAFGKKDKHKIEEKVPIELHLDYECSGQRFTVPVKSKNGRQPILQYELTLPHAAWAAGTAVKGRLALQQLDSRASLRSLTTSIVQSVVVKLKGGECSFKHEIANVTTPRPGSSTTQTADTPPPTLLPGDRLVELTIPPTALVSLDYEARGVRITHSLIIRLKFVDHLGREVELASSMGITVLSANQAVDAQRAGGATEAWVLGQAGYYGIAGAVGYPQWGVPPPMAAYPTSPPQLHYHPQQYYAGGQPVPQMAQSSVSFFPAAAPPTWPSDGQTIAVEAPTQSPPVGLQQQATAGITYGPPAQPVPPVSSNMSQGSYQ